MSDVLREEPEGKRDPSKVLKLVTAEPSQPDLWSQIAEEVSGDGQPKTKSKARAKKSAGKGALIIKPGKRDHSEPHPSTTRTNIVRAAVVEGPDEAELTSDTDESDIDETEGVVLEAAADTEVTDPLEETDAKSGRPQRVRGFVSSHFGTLAVGFVALILAVALVLSITQLNNKSALESSRASALGAARTYAQQIGGYNYNSLNADFGKVLSNSTPSFRHSYSQSSNALKSTLVKYKASATATVISAGIISATTNSASVLVDLNQVVKNTLTKSSTTSRSQISMNLSRSNGKWLINNVTIL
jgi:Mce-associated membrane protein